MSNYVGALKRYSNEGLADHIIGAAKRLCPKVDAKYWTRRVKFPTYLKTSDKNKAKKCAGFAAVDDIITEFERIRDTNSDHATKFTDATRLRHKMNVALAASHPAGMTLTFTIIQC